jgi:hypothetical protein
MMTLADLVSDDDDDDDDDDSNAAVDSGVVHQRASARPMKRAEQRWGILH